MQGLTKLAAVTILKNAATQAAEGINIEVVVELLIKQNTLTQQNKDLTSTHDQLKAEVSTLAIEVDSLKKKYDTSQELTKQQQESLDKEQSFGKLKANNLVALQVRLVDEIKDKDELETKVKDLRDELINACEDLWSTDELLWLTRNQLKVREQSLKVTLERGAQCNRTASMAFATTATSKDESTHTGAQRG